MHPTDRRQFRQGFWATALGTLASRVLGMLRDATTANLLGLAAGGVMDAFVLAFRMANLARRLLGEGALATSYLPVLRPSSSATARRRCAWPRRCWRAWPAC